MSHEASEAPRLTRSKSHTRHPSPSPSAATRGDNAAPPASGGGANNAATQRASARWLANLRQRLGSAAVLIALVIGIVFFGGWIAFAAAFIFLCIGAWEMSAMFAHKGWRPQIVISVALGVDFLVAAMFPAQRLLIISAGISACVILSFTVFLLAIESFENALRDWALTMAIPFYLGWPLALCLALRGYDFGFGSTGFWWLVAMFGMVWANDSAAYITGHFFGKTKLSPRISPAKTWEGFAGGLAFSIVAAFVLTLPLHLPWYAWLSMGALTAVAATIGDLAESLLKRGAGVKDSGQLIPGHGGMLDRMDSLLFAVIVVAAYAAFYDPSLLH
ncbi:MAG TPA: phosphatidate cytidylyltransferase [Ktedonobacterales bacterium]|nr:phosphatidate cytidylyltransferase [Ktedonobacterales bacterium]